MRISFCLLIIVFCSMQLSAQRFGGNPPSVKWYQVGNQAAQVIFPKGFDSAAVRVANVAGALAPATSTTIGEKQQRISVVLHPNTTVSNGYVALGPFRSEFYLTPSANSFELGSLRWQDMLAIHEYRHVQQYNNFNIGLSHAFRVVFGEQGQELANALSIPNWFWEGDAVFQETLVSDQGRGRLAYFFDDYRSLWLAGKRYSYMKLRNGSLRDFTPDHYRLGYMLVAYGRQQYGDGFWKDVTKDAASFKGLFYPFQKSVQKHAQVSFTQFTNDALSYFAKQADSSGRIQPTSRHFESDQEFPFRAGNDSIIYMESSYRSLPAFVLKTNSGSNRLRVRDLSLDHQFHYSNGKIVYASFRPATRWIWNDYSELQLLDIATGTQTTLTHRSKYFSPSLNNTADKIVAVEVRPGQPSALHILRAADGQLLKNIPNPQQFYFTYPIFLGEDFIVSPVRTNSGKMAIAKLRIADGDVEWLTDSSRRVIGPPVISGDTVYFTAQDKGYDRLFALSMPDKKIFRLNIPHQGVGIYQPSVSVDSIQFTSFSATGYRLQSVPKAALQPEAVDAASWASPDVDLGVQFGKTAYAGLLNTVGYSPLPTSKYPLTSKLFNFHSVLPYTSDPDYSISLIGNNLLNTMQSELSLGYNRNEQYKQLGTQFTYGGWLPYVNIGANYIFDRRDFSNTGKVINWNEGQASAGLSLPLNLSKGRSIASVNFGGDYVLKSVSYKGLYKDSLPNLNLSYLNSYLVFSHQLQQARQHIFPHFAQTLVLTYRRAIQSVAANQFLVSGTFYFPGLWYSHNLVFNLAMQNRDTLNQYRFSNSFPFSRGYESPNLRNLYKWGVNYHLPLLYPDWGFGNIVYFQRIRTNLFYDHTIGKVAYTNGARIDTDFRSFGAELFFDTKWWNELPLNFGIRYSHLMDKDLFGGTGNSRVEFVLPVNLFQR